MEIITETGYRDRMEKEVVPFLKNTDTAASSVLIMVRIKSIMKATGGRMQKASSQWFMGSLNPPRNTLR